MPNVYTYLSECLELKNNYFSRETQKNGPSIDQQKFHLFFVYPNPNTNRN